MKTQITRFTHYKLFFSLFFFFILSSFLPVTSYAMTPDGETPAVETDCSKLSELSGGSFGVCNAYCEAKDCDSDPEANEKSCNKILGIFAKFHPSFTMPCLQGPKLLIEKEINGSPCDGTGEDICKFVEGNTLLTLKFVVTNVGDVDLIEVKITDKVNKEPLPIDVCELTLAIGESKTCTLEPFLAEAEVQVDTATVTAVNAEYGPDPESAEDTARYKGVPAQPLVSLTKEIGKNVNGELVFDDCPLAEDGSVTCHFDKDESLTFRITVTNEGNVKLTINSLTDTDTTNPEEPDTTNICVDTLPPSLAIGENFTCTFTSVADIGVHSDEAEVTTAEGPASSDTASYKGLDPEVALDKQIGEMVNGEMVFKDCPTDGVTCSFVVGTPLTFRIKVTNTGNVDLTIASLKDNGADIDCAEGIPPASLEPDDAFICTFDDSVATEGEHTNTATVTTYEGPTASDTAKYFAGKIVFVTSNRFQGDLDGSSLGCSSADAHIRADCICKAVADGTGETNPIFGKEWVAWISTGEEPTDDDPGGVRGYAKNYFSTNSANGPWFNLRPVIDGGPEKVADNLSDLTTAKPPDDNYLHAPIKYAENGDLNRDAWTGTTPLGSGTTNCGDWSSNLSGDKGVFGITVYLNGFWTRQPTEISCWNAVPIVCFQK